MQFYGAFLRSFCSFFLKIVSELHPRRAVCEFIRRRFGVVGSTFVTFLMGIVPNNHQINYNNEKIIIGGVGSGGAGADGV